MKSKYWGIVLFIAFGAAKVPMEDAMTQRLREQRLQLPAPKLSWEENFTQLAFSTLGGMRNLFASICYLQGYTAFVDLDWGRLDTLMTLSTRLQPTEITYWDEAAWNMSYNAASSYMRDKTLRFAVKHQRYNENVDRGIAILHEGLSYNPDNWTLLKDLAEIYGGGMPRRPDPRLAAKYFTEAYAHSPKRRYEGIYERMGAYEMVKLGDRASWEKAYEILKRHYDTDSRCRAMASVLRDLPILEERLNIPPEKRIKPAKPFVPPSRPVLPKPPGVLK